MDDQHRARRSVQYRCFDRGVEQTREPVALARADGDDGGTAFNGDADQHRGRVADQADRLGVGESGVDGCVFGDVFRGVGGDEMIQSALGHFGDAPWTVMAVVMVAVLVLVIMLSVYLAVNAILVLLMLAKARGADLPAEPQSAAAAQETGHEPAAGHEASADSSAWDEGRP